MNPFDIFFIHVIGGALLADLLIVAIVMGLYIGKTIGGWKRHD